MKQTLLYAVWILLAVSISSPCYSLNFKVDRRGLSAGTSMGEVRFRSDQGAVDLLFVEAELAMPLVSLQPVISLEGPNHSSALEELALSVNAIAAMGIELEPIPDAANKVEGLRYVDGRLYSWPSTDQKHLYLYADGYVDLRVPQKTEGTIEFADGFQLELVSINGALPEQRGQASLYTGKLDADQLPVVLWPHDLIVVSAEPAIAGKDPHRNLIGGGGSEHAFVPRGVEIHDSIHTRSNQVLLLLPGPVSPEVIERFRKGVSFIVNVPLGDLDGLAMAIVPLYHILMDEGEETVGLDRKRIIKNAIALDREGRRLLFISPSNRHGYGGGISFSLMQEMLVERKYNTLVELEDRTPLLLPNLKDTNRDRDAANAPVRLALAIQAQASSLQLPDIDGDLYRIKSVVVAGTRREFQANLAGALRDEAFLSTGKLNQFWAAPFDRKLLGHGSEVAQKTNSLRLLLSRPMPLTAIELIHVSAAGFSPELNLKAWRLWGKPRRNSPWELLLDIDSEKPVMRQRLVVPNSPRMAELRLEIVVPNFMPGGDVARLGEVILWSTEQEVKKR